MNLKNLYKFCTDIFRELFLKYFSVLTKKITSYVMCKIGKQFQKSEYKFYRKIQTGFKMLFLLLSLISMLQHSFCKRIFSTTVQKKLSRGENSSETNKILTFYLSFFKRQ